MFQLDFEDFDLEQSHTCSYDSLTVLGDVEGAEEIGRTLPISPCCRFGTCAVIADKDLVAMCLCSGAVRRQPPSCRPVLPQRHGAAVRLGRQRRTQRLQGVTDVHQPLRCETGG